MIYISILLFGIIGFVYLYRTSSMRGYKYICLDKDFVSTVGANYFLIRGILEEEYEGERIEVIAAHAFNNNGDFVSSPEIELESFKELNFKLVNKFPWEE